MADSMAAALATAAAPQVSDETLRDALRDHLRDADLDTVTPRAVRERLCEQFGVDLSGRKAFIKAAIVAVLAELHAEAVAAADKPTSNRFSHGRTTGSSGGGTDRDTSTDAKAGTATVATTQLEAPRPAVAPLSTAKDAPSKKPESTVDPETGRYPRKKQKQPTTTSAPRQTVTTTATPLPTPPPSALDRVNKGKTAFQYELELAPALAKFLGAETMSRHEVRPPYCFFPDSINQPFFIIAKYQSCYP